MVTDVSGSPHPLIAETCPFAPAARCVQIESLEERSRCVEGECEARVKAIAGLVSDVQCLMKELKLDTLSALDQQVMGSLPRPGSTCLTSLDASASCVGIHADVLQRLTDRAAELVAEKVRRGHNTTSMFLLCLLGG